MKLNKWRKNMQLNYAVIYYYLTQVNYVRLHLFIPLFFVSLDAVIIISVLLLLFLLLLQLLICNKLFNWPMFLELLVVMAGIFLILLDLNFSVADFFAVYVVASVGALKGELTVTR